MSDSTKAKNRKVRMKGLDGALGRLRKAMGKAQDELQGKGCNLKKIPAECIDWWKFAGMEERGDAKNKAAIISMVGKSEQFWRHLLDGGEPRWLTMAGESGCGKTHLARKIHRAFYLMTRLQKQGDVYLGPGKDLYRASFYSWPQIAANFMEGAYGVMNDIAEDWMVVIDDIGATRTQSDRIESLVWDKLFTALARREGKWTVLTTNLTFMEIASRESRLASRLRRAPNMTKKCEALPFEQIRRPE